MPDRTSYGWIDRPDQQRYRNENPYCSHAVGPACHRQVVGCTYTTGTRL